MLTQRERPSYDPDESAHMILHRAAEPSLAEAMRKDDGELPERSFLRAKSDSAPPPVDVFGRRAQSAPDA